MRVVWFSHSSEMGGAELCLAEAVESLRSRGVESHVVLPRSGPLGDHFASLGIPVITQLYWWWMAAGGDRAISGRARRAGRNALALAPLTNALRGVKPDVVVTNTLTIPVGGLAARALGLPHLWSVLEFGAEDHGLHPDWGDRITHRLIDGLSTRVCAISESVKRRVAEWGVAEDRIDVVHPSVLTPDGVADPVRPDGPLRLVVVGAKYPGKRQEDAVRAVGILAAAGRDVRLTLIGREDAEYGQRLRDLVVRLGLEQRVEIRGGVPRQAALAAIAASHLFVMPSRSEAFGRVTVEAMKLGRAVVGADRAGTAELIRDGWNGMLYEAENPEDLASKLASADADRSRVSEMGRNARDWSLRAFTPESLAQAMLASLAATVRDGRRPG